MSDTPRTDAAIASANAGNVYDAAGGVIESVSYEESLIDHLRTLCWNLERELVASQARERALLHSVATKAETDSGGDPGLDNLWFALAGAEKARREGLSGDTILLYSELRAIAHAVRGLPQSPPERRGAVETWPRVRECPECKGVGSLPYTGHNFCGTRECERCRGEGKVRDIIEPPRGSGVTDDARDAARYRWLRSEDTATNPLYYPFWQEFQAKLCREQHMDALIDSAMTSRLVAACPTRNSSEKS